jgi:cob(I)alamin adenosyltransferase
MTPIERMQAIDAQLAHVWMVRAFLKHSDEAASDEELAEVHRDLYDYMLALGAPLSAGDADTYLKLATKKFARLRKATETFAEIQPEVSTHTNFQMAARSLTKAVAEVGTLVQLGASAGQAVSDAGSSSTD